MAKNPPTLKTLDQFLFEVPPYAPHKVASPFDEDDKEEVAAKLYRHSGETVTIDGHCPFCHKDSTFSFSGQFLSNTASWENFNERVAYDHVAITCVRNKYHVIRYWFFINHLLIEKVGQFPSLATVSNDEVAPFRKLLSDEDGKEFHKAIGLAAHGIGVGSFVYLRRVFERIIYRRFAEFKDAEGWTDEQFYSVKMEEKIALLKGHLPSFLVENRKVYSILSIGIHELDEEACLSYFEVMKQAILIILEDDQKTRRELERRATFAKAIAGFQPPEKMEQ